jgi:hypothetical protein
MPTYIIADPDSSCGWTHIWNVHTSVGDVVDVERPCRFVLDRVRVRLVHLDIEIDGTMVPATAEEAEDLLDSPVNANPDVMTIRSPTAFRRAIACPPGARPGASS